MISKSFRSRAEYLKQVAQSAIQELYPESIVEIQFLHEHRRELIDEARFFIKHPSGMNAYFTWSSYNKEEGFIKILIRCCWELTNEVILKYEQKIRKAT